MMVVTNTQKESEVFFVGLHNQEELNKVILESMKQTLQTLQRYEDFRQIRLEKKRSIDDLKKLVKEINVIMGNLKTALPKSNLNENYNNVTVSTNIPIPKKSIKIEDKIVHAPSENKSKVDKNDLKKLEAELADIESKLNSL
jgi:hypothetical protein